MFSKDEMDEIRQIFVEESNEGLDIMESGLLELTPGSLDTATINNIFRAAHSIKGGGGTFGFSEISNFTHGVETLLDEVRGGARQITEHIIQLFLECVDCLRDMLAVITHGGSEYDTARIAELTAQMQTLIDQGPELQASAVQDTAQNNTPIHLVKEQNAQPVRHWKIHFQPQQDIVKGGNEPYRIFRELAKLGQLDVKAKLDEMPAFSQMDPESCYLVWKLQLAADVDIGEIEEVFSWISEECSLEIQETEHALIDPPNALAIDAGTEPSIANNALKEVLNVNELADLEAANEQEQATASKEMGSVRVNIEKIDNVLDLVGELVITQSMLARFGDDYSEDSLEELRDGLALLSRNARELQESTMQIRMLPIKVVFSRFPRLIRDLSSKLDKKIHLELQGESTEIDKIIMEKLGDPLVHLIRNAVDHGIESRDIRSALGKPEVGTIKLSAVQEAGNVVIRIADDGAGLNKEKILQKAIAQGLVTGKDQLSDEQIHNLVFHPGFSTADAVSDLSGRGVGMDVVNSNISSLGGSVTIKSREGVGSEITVRLPLTLAIMEGQLVGVGDAVYVVPLLAILESVLLDSSELSAIAGGLLVYHFRNEYIPIVSLGGEQGYFGARCQVEVKQQLQNKLLVVCEVSGSKIGLLVDQLNDQQQVVIKTLESNFKKTPGLLGATILGTGRVALILDVAGLSKLYVQSNQVAPLEQRAIA